MSEGGRGTKATTSTTPRRAWQPSHKRAHRSKHWKRLTDSQQRIRNRVLMSVVLHMTHLRTRKSKKKTNTSPVSIGSITSNDVPVFFERVSIKTMPFHVMSAPKYHTVCKRRTSRMCAIYLFPVRGFVKCSAAIVSVCTCAGSSCWSVFVTFVRTVLPAFSQRQQRTLGPSIAILALNYRR